MSSVPVPGTAPEVAPLSQGARIVNTFIAPRKTFTDLRRSAMWWAPFLLIIVVQIFLAAAVDKQVTYRKVVENQTQMSPKAVERMERMPPDQREQIMKQQTTGTRVFWYAFPIALLILDLIFASLYFGTFRLGFNSDIKYKTALAVVVYASLPYIVKSLLAALFLLAGVNTDTFVFQNPIASNPGYFLAAADSPFLYGVASAIDVFALWSIILTGLGFAYAGKTRKSSAIGAVVAWYVIVTLFFSGLGAAFS